MAIAWNFAASYPRSLKTSRAARTIRSRVSAAFAAGGRPGPRVAVYGTVKLCHTRDVAAAPVGCGTMKMALAANHQSRQSGCGDQFLQKSDIAESSGPWG